MRSIDTLKDPRAPMHIETDMINAGLVEVDCRMILVPLSPWQKGKQKHIFHPVVPQRASNGARLTLTPLHRRERQTNRPTHVRFNRRTPASSLSVPLHEASPHADPGIRATHQRRRSRSYRSSLQSIYPLVSFEFCPPTPVTSARFDLTWARYVCLGQKPIR